MGMCVRGRARVRGGGGGAHPRRISAAQSRPAAAPFAARATPTPAPRLRNPLPRPPRPHPPPPPAPIHALTHPHPRTRTDQAPPREQIPRDRARAPRRVVHTNYLGDLPATAGAHSGGERAPKPPPRHAPPRAAATRRRRAVTTRIKGVRTKPTRIDSHEGHEARLIQRQEPRQPPCERHLPPPPAPARQCGSPSRTHTARAGERARTPAPSTPRGPRDRSRPQAPLRRGALPRAPLPRPPPPPRPHARWRCPRSAPA